MKRRTFFTLSAGAAIAAVCCVAFTFGAPAKAGGDRVRIVTSIKSKRALDDAQKIADLARVAGEQFLGTTSTRNAYVVTIYPTLAEYQAKDKELTEGKYADAWALTTWNTKESFIALMPPMGEPALDAAGLSLLMKTNIAHEFAKQYMFYVVTPFRVLPDWLTEGIASAIELDAVRRAGLVTDIGKMPFYARDIVLARGMFANGTWPGAARIFADDYGSIDGWHRAAIWRVFVGWLFDDVWKNNRKTLIAELRKVAETAPEAKKKITAIFTKSLGKRIDKLDAEFQAYLETLHPEWDETLRSTEVRDGDVLSIAFDSSDSLCARLDPVGAASYTVSGSIEFLQGGKGELRFVVAAASPTRLETGLVVRFVRGDGASAVWAPKPEDGMPGLSGKKMLEGKPTPFTIRIEPERAEVAIDGEHIATVPIMAPKDGGYSAHIAGAGSGGWWRDLKVTPAK